MNFIFYFILPDFLFCFGVTMILGVADFEDSLVAGNARPHASREPSLRSVRLRHRGASVPGSFQEIQLVRKLLQRVQGADKVGPKRIHVQRSVDGE